MNDSDGLAICTERQPLTAPADGRDAWCAPVNGEDHMASKTETETIRERLVREEREAQEKRMAELRAKGNHETGGQQGGGETRHATPETRGVPRAEQASANARRGQCGSVGLTALQARRFFVSCPAVARWADGPPGVIAC